MRRLCLFTVALSPLFAADEPELIARAPETFYTPPLPSMPPAPLLPPPHKNMFLSMGLSTLIPGLGHMYLGDTRTAGGLLSTTGLSVGTLVALGGENHQPFFPAFATLEATWFYGLYSVYRDTRLYNGSSGYSYQMPTDQFSDLVYAPFRWSVMKKPEVWGGLLGALTIAVGVTYFAYPQGAAIHSPASSSKDWMPLAAFPIGIGEESFFRGYLQSQLSESLTPWGGIAVSSLAFGAAHIPNARAIAREHRWRYYSFSLPVITGIGAYCGWLTHKNHSLQEGVAVHTWYDFVLFGATALASHAAATGSPGVALAVPF